MKKIEFFFIFFISLLTLFLSFYPIIYRYQTTPPGRVYVGTEFFTEDFAGYVSTINQGRKGNIWYEDKFTSEELPQTILYYPYLIFGHLARFLGLSAPVMYHLIRLTLGALYLFAVYLLIKHFFPNQTKADSFKRIVTFLIITYTSSLFTSVLSQTTAEIQVFTRFLIQPHYLLGNIFLLFLIYLFIKFISHLEDPTIRRGCGDLSKEITTLISFARNDKMIVFSSITIFLLTFFRPSHTLIILLSVFLYAIYLLFKKSLSGKFFVYSLCIFLSSLPGVFYLLYLKNTYPFLPYFAYDKNSISVSLVDFVFSFGLNLIFIIVGFFILIRKKNTNQPTIFLFSYLAAIFFSLFIAPNLLPLNALRFVQTPTFIIVGLLTSLVIFKLTKNFYLIIASCVLVLVSSFPTLITDFRHQVKLYYDAYYIWPPKSYFAGFSFLEKNSRPEEIVLTYHSLSNLVPMFSGNTVYWGHGNETLNYQEKKMQVENFYSGKMSETEAKSFLSKNSVRYVLVGIEEKNLGWRRYSFIKQVFTNPELTIYSY